MNYFVGERYWYRDGWEWVLVTLHRFVPKTERDLNRMTYDCVINLPRPSGRPAFLYTFLKNLEENKRRD